MNSISYFLFVSTSAAFSGNGKYPGTLPIKCKKIGKFKIYCKNENK